MKKVSLIFSIIFLVLAAGSVGGAAFIEGAEHHFFTAGICFVVAAVSFCSYKEEVKAEV